MGAESFGGAGYGEYGDDAPGVVKNGGGKASKPGFAFADGFGVTGAANTLECGGGECGVGKNGVSKSGRCVSHEDVRGGTCGERHAGSDGDGVLQPGRGFFAGDAGSGCSGEAVELHGFPGALHECIHDGGGGVDKRVGAAGPE